MGLTIASPVEFRGFGVFTGREVRVVVTPREESGVLLRAEGISAPVEKWELVRVPNRTALAMEGTKVELVEHFFGVFNVLGITSAEVSVDGGEFPIFDGSGAFYLREFERVGFRGAEGRWLEVGTTISVREGEKLVCVFPSSERAFTYYFDHPSMGVQCAIFGNEDLKRVLEARTFITEKELEQLKSVNELFLHGSEGILVGDDGQPKTKLRFPEEFAAHKVLDFLGDIFAAVGRPLAGGGLGVMSGHGLNFLLGKKLREVVGVK